MPKEKFDYTDADRQRAEDYYDELVEDGRSPHYDICLCSDDSFKGCPKHDPLCYRRCKKRE